MDNLKQIFLDIDNNVNIGEQALVDNPESCMESLNLCSDSFTIIHQNIRSISKNFDSFMTLLVRLNISFDIIVLTECWLDSGSIIPTIPNYTSHHTTKKINQNSGVVVFVKDKLKISVLEVDIPDTTGLVIKIGINHAVICMYRSPFNQRIDDFLTSIDTELENFKSVKNLIMIGDINIDIINRNKDSRSYDYLNLFAAHGLLSSHCLPTRGSSCIDHCFVKSSNKIKTLVCQSTITDHSCLVMSLSKGPSKILDSTRFVTKTNYKNAVNDMTMMTWDDIYECDHVDIATNLFITKITDIIKKNTESHRVSAKKFIIKPWITPGMMRCMKWRDKLHLKLRKSPNNLVLQITYKRYRNYCNKILKNLKISFERAEIQKGNGDTKKTWSTLKKICNFDANYKSPTCLLNIEKTYEDSANSINSYFVNVGKNLADTYLRTSNRTVHELESDIRVDDGPLNSLVLDPTDEYEVRKIISSLKNTYSCGWDGIPTAFLKQAMEFIVEPFTYICNLSISSSTFPTALKRSVVMPIYKSGDADSVSNYRPISLLPSLAKILEKLLNSRLIKFLEKYNLISQNQYGFREGRSTTDAMNHLVTHITKKLDVGEKCVGVFLDLAKAFDTVSIPILLRKLEKLGIRGQAHKLFESYLSDRTQSVKLGLTRSTDEPINYGVPQGSVLGPTLFLIFIDDLCRLNLLNAQIITFADDTVIVFNAGSMNELQLIAEKEFAKVVTCLNNNILTLNLSKTKYIVFSKNYIKRKTTNPISFRIKAHTCSDMVHCSCYTLSATKSIKYLGITLDCNLSWKEQISSLTNRARKLIFISKKIRHINDAHTIKMIYFALCQSIIQYGILVWGSARKSNLIKLERAQRAIIKVLNYKTTRYPTSELYKEFAVLTVRQLYIKTLLLRQHKMDKTQLTCKRRHDLVFNVPFCRTSYAQTLTDYLGPSIYNKISKEFTLKTLTFQQCKKELDRYLKRLDYDSTELLLATK